MGTSSQSKGTGSNTPLVPNWLDEPSPGNPPASPQQPSPSEEPPAQNDNPAFTPPAQPAEQPQRFRMPRTNFSRFVSSGGTDSRALGRAISGYVSSGAGGARNATRRMGSAVATAGNVASFFSDAQRSGFQQTLRKLNLDRLATQPLNEILVGLTDVLCPPGGPIDEAIARDAWLETIVEVTELGVTDFENLTPELLEEIFITYVSKSVEGRVFYDIGTKGIAKSNDLDVLNRLQSSLHDYICGHVRDAFHSAHSHNSFGEMNQAQINRMVESTYHNAWTILEAFGEEET